MTVGEIPSHNHSGTISTIALTGSFSNNGHASGRKATGCFSATKDNTMSNAGNASDGGMFNFKATHSHTVSINNNGSNQSHNNMPPYFSVYIWKRTA
ncbi:phage baseplate protein [Megamonas rupellensis]|uniref:phage baseplate protein n=1 Tax=Megamonas rupellensis TaxID=491921 RepID=UPI003D16BB28